VIGKFGKAYMLVKGKSYNQKVKAYFCLFFQNFHQFQIGGRFIITCKKQQRYHVDLLNAISSSINLSASTFRHFATQNACSLNLSNRA
jgi:hypothetical protein